MDDTAQLTSWLDILKTGVSGIIDSQIARQYAINDPAYNTAGGRGGQAQVTPSGNRGHAHQSGEPGPDCGRGRAQHLPAEAVSRVPTRLTFGVERWRWRAER